MSSLLLQFGVFGDAHFANATIGDRHCTDSLTKLKDCISILNRKKIQLVFNMGDLVDRAETDSPGAEKAYLSQILPVLWKFNGTIHNIIGNHDVTGMTKQTFMDMLGYKHSSSFYSFDIYNVHCVVLDGNFNEDWSDFSPEKNNWENAWFPPNEMNWLRNDLTQNKDKPSIIFIHENCDNRMINGVPDPHLLRNVTEVREIIERYGNVKAVVQAHYHEGFATIINKIAYFGITAMCKGAGPENNAFAIISLYNNGTLEVEGFGRQKSLILETTNF